MRGGGYRVGCPGLMGQIETSPFPCSPIFFHSVPLWLHCQASQIRPGDTRQKNPDSCSILSHSVPFGSVGASRSGWGCQTDNDTRRKGQSVGFGLPEYLEHLFIIMICGCLADWQGRGVIRRGNFVYWRSSRMGAMRRAVRPWFDKLTMKGQGLPGRGGVCRPRQLRDPVDSPSIFA